jgi:hypothetical protein
LPARRAHHSHLAVEKLSTQLDEKSVRRNIPAHGAVDRIDFVLPTPGDFAGGDLELVAPSN